MISDVTNAQFLLFMVGVIPAMISSFIFVEGKAKSQWIAKALAVLAATCMLPGLCHLYSLAIFG
jgi:hypothetical protein